MCGIIIPFIKNSTAINVDVWRNVQNPGRHQTARRAPLPLILLCQRAKRYSLIFQTLISSAIFLSANRVGKNTTVKHEGGVAWLARDAFSIHSYGASGAIPTGEWVIQSRRIGASSMKLQHRLDAYVVNQLGLLHINIICSSVSLPRVSLSLCLSHSLSSCCLWRSWGSKFSILPFSFDFFCCRACPRSPRINGRFPCGHMTDPIPIDSQPTPRRHPRRQQQQQVRWPRRMRTEVTCHDPRRRW